MPVVNDFPGLYERITQQATQLANSIGIQPEIIIQYFNDTAHFPQTLDELTRWGDTPDPTYGFRRRQPNGVWTPLMQGDTPGTGGANDPGFKHIIANEVGKVQRFQQVDPSGNVFGGSWDPAYNAAHPELRGTGAETTRIASGDRISGAGTQMNAQSVDTSSPAYQAANPSGQPYGQATGATPTASGGTVQSTAASGGGATGGNVGYDPAQVAAAVNAANIAQQIAYNNKKLELDRDISLRLDAREKERIALEAGRDAWKKTYDTAVLTGKLPDGTPTIDATKTTADITGYQPNPAAGKGQAVMDAVAALRTNPQYLALDGAGRRQMEAATVSQITGVDTASAAQAIDRLRQLSATTGQMSSAALVEQVIGQTPAGQRPSLDREKEQNANAIAALTLLSNLRGPENAFAYSDTLAGLPESVRANIQAAMGRLPFTAQNPAQRGVLGDVGALGPGAPVGGGQQPGGMEMTPGQPGEPLVLLPDGTIGHRPPGWTAPGQTPGQGISARDSTPGFVAPVFNQTTLPPATGPRTQQQQALQFLPAPAAAPGTPQYQEAQMAQQYPAPTPGQPGPTPVGRIDAGPPPAGQPGQVGLGDFMQRQLGPGGVPAWAYAPGSGWSTQPVTHPGATLGPRGDAYGGTTQPLPGSPQGRWGSPQTPYPGRPWPQAPFVGNPAGGNTGPGMAAPLYGPRTQPVRPATAAGMTLPGQLSPTDWNNTSEYQRKLLLAGYEHAGEDINNVQDEYKRSLPKAYGPRTGRLRAA